MNPFFRALLCLALVFCMAAGLCACSFSQLAQDVAVRKIEAIPRPETKPLPETEPTVPEIPAPSTPVSISAIAGEYEFYSMSDGYSTFSAKEIETMMDALGEDLICLILHEDGTGSLSGYALDESMEMAWDETYIWPKDDPSDRVAYTYRDNQITLQVDDYVLVLQKEVLTL